MLEHAHESPRHGAAANNGLPHPAESAHRRFRALRLVLEIARARLRFVAILAAVGGAIAYWDTLNAHYEKWFRTAAPADSAAGADVEYWCPMHPSVVRDHSDKCPVCSMPLSKRKKSEGGVDEALPPGVVSRVQLTPYRVALAGIRTVSVDYRALSRGIDAVGSVEFDERKLIRIADRVTGKSRIDKLYVNFTGQIVTRGDPLAVLYSPELPVTLQILLDDQRSGNRDLVRMARRRLALWGVDDAQIDQLLRNGKPTTELTIRAPVGGHVIRKYAVEGEYVEEGAPLFDLADLSTVWIEAQVYEDDLPFVRVGQEVSATTKAFPNKEFRGTVSILHPHLDAATRTLKVRIDAPNPDHELRPGMYANVKVRAPVTGPDASPAPSGMVLAVPERAVIDTGSRKIVYRESEPNVFDGVEVKLGPRCGDYYPVLSGLRAGDTVAGAGSFLIDAETRLNSGLGSTYFGAGGGPATDKHAATVRPSMTEDDEARAAAALSKLSPEDRKAAAEQGVCPVQPDNVLGTMGVPTKVVLDGRAVFLCCTKCVPLAERDPQGTLAKVAALQAGAKKPPPVHDHHDAGGKLGANLAKLSAEDRKLAEAQGVCPIQPEKRLGVMGVPVKVMLQGRAVFLCCKGCGDDAVENPDRTLTKVAALQAKAGKESRP